MAVITVTCEDCMALMARHPDKYFDIAIVDPPYGAIAGQEFKTNNGHFNLGSNGRFDKYFKPVEHLGHRRTENSTAYNWQVKYCLNRVCDWDVAPPREYFDELFRVSKRRIVWGGNYFSDKLPPSRNYIVWDKVNITKAFSMGMVEQAWTDIPGNPIKIPCNPQDKERFHPTQKPVMLYKELLAMYAKPGYKILDTHMGSGTCAIACIDAGLDFTGCEIDAEYYKKLTARIKDYIKQGNLFEETELREERGNNEEKL